jgi:hypothetical protein
VVVVAAAPPTVVWAEVLDLGGFDVLPKLFHEKEVTRLVTLACSRPRHQRQDRRPPVERSGSPLTPARTA